MTLDLQNIGAFRGAAGSVRSLTLPSTLPYLAAVGLDRFVRVFNFSKHSLISKVYLKQHLNCVIFSIDQKVEVDADEEVVWDQIDKNSAGSTLMKQQQESIDCNAWLNGDEAVDPKREEDFEDENQKDEFEEIIEDSDVDLDSVDDNDFQESESGVEQSRITKINQMKARALEVKKRKQGLVKKEPETSESAKRKKSNPKK